MCLKSGLTGKTKLAQDVLHSGRLTLLGEMRMRYAGSRQQWIYRLLTCCSFTLGGMGFEGMWGDALKMTPGAQTSDGSEPS